MKINNYHITIILVILLFMLNKNASAETVDNSFKQNNYAVPLIEIFGAGVNISLLEHTWETPEKLLNTDITSKLLTIKNIGFKTVRLPVAFDMYLQPNSSNFNTQLLDKIGETYNTCKSLGLNLIITYHYGKVYYGSDNRWKERERILWMWKQMQNKFRGMGYTTLFFELYNEPTEERSGWKEDINYIINGLRWEDKERYFIIGGTNYNNADELLDLGKLGDDRILYTIHFYEPYIFTHQGAEWIKDRAYMTKIPYPYNKKKMPDLNKSSIGSAVEQDYTKYPAEGTKEYIALRIRRIADECKKRNMPLLCTETGVINLADEKYRRNYFEDITNIMDGLDIPVMLWDYDEKFSIFGENGKPIKEIRKWVESKKK